MLYFITAKNEEKVLLMGRMHEFKGSKGKCCYF